MQKLLKELEKGSYLPAYIFYGEEFYTMGEAVEKFTAFFTNEHADDLNVERLDASKCQVNEVLNAVATMGFFSSQKLV